ncbi:MAG: sugar MFS transporter [Chlorobi bacterium]|nr:sugar MFS transporter [Chlorobiota bacterium]
MKKKNYTVPFVIVTGLFFMWGFITSMNDILIPYLKEVFELTHFKAMLVQFAFFGAYFIGSLFYFFISARMGDPINRMGYKNGIIYGLLLSALGTSLFYPAAQLVSYGFFLSALFVLGLGFTLLQIAANPYVAILGNQESASSRLNLSQGFNSFGTTIGPLIGGYLIFKYFVGADFVGADSVKIPYLIFAGIFLLMAVLIKLSHLPRFFNKEDIEKGTGALRFRHLLLGMVAIFMYVGAEVSIGSIMVSFLGLENIAGFSKEEASTYLAFYWGGLMIGRFLGALSLSEMKGSGLKLLYMALSAVILFFVIYLAAFLKSGIDIMDIWPFGIIILVNFIAFHLGKSMPGKTLLVFSLMAVLLLLIAVSTNGYVAMWTLIGVGIFNSIMWPNIFTLSISGLGKYTSQGSSLLVMMILGGAIIPVIQGAIADAYGVHLSFIVPVIPYLYIAFFGWKGHKQKKTGL